MDAQEVGSSPLLLDIARCPVIAVYLAQPHLHPCMTIIGVQSGTTPEVRQVPEPWSGELARAPILFLSSNPSISDDEVYPRGMWSDERITDFFDHRFGGGLKRWTEGGLTPLRDDGTPREGWVRFWASVRARATELLERKPVPGADYAISEVVHCKSEAEAGVKDAAVHCADRYLTLVLTASPARVIVVLGTIASDQVRRVFNLSSDRNVYGPLSLAGAERYVACIPHPNARRPRSLAACLDPNDLGRLRAALRALE